MLTLSPLLLLAFRVESRLSRDPRQATGGGVMVSGPDADRIAGALRPGDGVVRICDLRAAVAAKSLPHECPRSQVPSRQVVPPGSQAKPSTRSSHVSSHTPANVVEIRP
jgi:hypothetical protein